MAYSAMASHPQATAPYATPPRPGSTFQAGASTTMFQPANQDMFGNHQSQYQSQAYRQPSFSIPSAPWGTAAANGMVPGWMNTSPYPTPGLRTPQYGASGLTGGYLSTPARSPLNPGVNAFSPQSFTYSGTANQDNEFNPFFKASAYPGSPESNALAAPALTAFKKPNSQHRSSPSISALRKQLGDAPTGPSYLTPGRSPLLSRGVSPAPSASSAAASGPAPLHDALGLPLNKPRIYKVKLPLESSKLNENEVRKQSIWTRQPCDLQDDGLPWYITEEEARSKSPHPEESVSASELPDTIDIYLPNDWRGLRDALYEDKLAALGITREYLQHIDTLLGGKSAAPTPVKNASQTSGPHSPLSHMNRPHLRTGSLSFGPTRSMPDVPPLSPLGSPEMMRSVNPFGLRRGHSSTMSMAAFSKPAAAPLGAGLRGDAPSFTFGERRQRAPAGPRDPFSLFPMPGPGYAPTSPSIVEEDEEEADDNKEDIGAAKPARLLSLKELSVGFGISDSESDVGKQAILPTFGRPGLLASSLAAEAKPFVPSAPPAIAVEAELLTTQDLPLERIPIEGAIGHASVPSSALIQDLDELSPRQDTHVNSSALLQPGHETRRSVSAPDLHQLLAEVKEAHGADEGEPQSPFVTSETGYAVESGADSDRESIVSRASKRSLAEYSNPSEEERARERRNLSRFMSSPLAAMHKHSSDSSITSLVGLGTSAVSPTASFIYANGSSILRNSVAEKWLDRHESEEIISNPSDEEEILANLGLTDSRRPSWTPSMLSQANTFGEFSLHSTAGLPGRPDYLHAANVSYASATSSTAKSNGTAEQSRTSLNAAAPAFVFGGKSQTLPSLASTALPNLNPSASEFKPSFTFSTTGPALPQTATGTASNGLGEEEEDEDEEREVDDRENKRSKVDDKEGVVWLSDISPEPTATLPPGIQPLTPGFSTLQSFRFPPAPVLGPVSPASKPSPLSPIAPQLPPLGTIGRNTPLRAAFGALNFAGSPRKASIPDGFGNAIPSRSPTRTKTALPDFSFVPRTVVEEDHPAAQNAKQIAKSPSVILRDGAGLAPVTISEFGASREPSPLEERITSAPHSLSPAGSAHESEVEYDGSSSEASSASGNGDHPNAARSPSLSSASIFAYSEALEDPDHALRHIPDKELTKSWKLFEAILDRKIDALRLDVFSHSTPLPPPLLSAEVSDALATSIVDAIKDELPLRSSISIGSGAPANESISKELLTAIHETQDLLSDLSRRSTSSADAIVNMLKNKQSRDARSLAGSDAETMYAKIQEAVRASMESLRDQSSTAGLAAGAIAQAFESKLEHLMGKASNRGDDNQILQKLEELNTRSEDVSRELAQLLQNQFAAALEDVKAALPALLAENIPAEGGSAEILATLQAIHESFSVGQTRLDASLKSVSSDNQAFLDLIKEKHTLELACSEAKADAVRLRTAQETESEYVERERERYEQELTSLRQAAQAKDKQIEVLRAELLARATSMDADAKEQEKAFTAKENEWNTLRGGMEAELAIYRAQAKESAEEKQRTEEKLERMTDRMHEVGEEQLMKISELSHQTESQKSQIADLQQQLREQTSKSAEGEALLQDAQMAVHASGGRLLELRQANTSLKTELAGLSRDLEASRISACTAKALLAAHQADHASNTKMIADQAARIEDLEDHVALLRSQSERAQQTSLALLLHRDKLGSALSFAPTSTYFDISHSGRSDSLAAAATMSRDSSTSETAPEMVEDDASTEVSSDDTVSFAAGDTTAASLSDTSMVDKGDISARIGLRRTLTADDSGWFS